MALSAGALCVLLVALAARRAAPNPVRDPDKTLAMFLKLESGSETSLPSEGGSATFRCDILDYAEPAHVVTWTRFDAKSVAWVVLAEAGTLRSPADHRMLVSRLQATNASRRGNVHQRLVIDPVRDSDQGLYRCSVRASAGNTTGPCGTVASRELALTVRDPEIFPVCSPAASSADPLVRGDTVSCGTLVGSRVPVVTRRGSRAGEPEDWPKAPRRDGRPGWELTREVNATDDGVVYDCWSFSAGREAGEPALSCSLAPRVVGGGATEAPAAPGLTTGAIVGIVAGAVVVAAVVVVVVVCLCCCCCN